MHALYDTEEKPKKNRKSVLFWKIGSLIFGGILFGSFAGLALLLLLSANKDSFLESSYSYEDGESYEESVFSQPDSAASGVVTSEESKISLSSTGAGMENRTQMVVVTDVTDVVNAVMPSVVSIFGTYVVSDRFWGYEIAREDDGSGSGIIIGENEEEILIVTNQHVVQDSTALGVTFVNEETYDATVKGKDPGTDLAVISVRLSDLSEETKEAIQIAALGDSDLLKVGEPAIAIGNAMGFGQSVTTGVISALNRDYRIDEKGDTLSLIQTDAAINPGNSGGALLNVEGQVIGITSSKIACNAVEGMGYAIPISEVKPIIEELTNKKTRMPVSAEEKGYLGISGINITEDLQHRYGLPVGVYISQVFQGTAASSAGIEKGDIIISFDGETVETMEELSGLLDCTKEGSKVLMDIMEATPEGYERKNVEVVLMGRN